VSLRTTPPIISPSDRQRQFFGLEMVQPVKLRWVNIFASLQVVSLTTPAEASTAKELGFAPNEAH
jgi:hypothetical protein